jgi:hypothetical protein
VTRDSLRAGPEHADPLRIYGNLFLLEMAPVLLAAERFYPGKTVIEHGSVLSLWGKSSDLASLGSAGQSDIACNSETQALRASSANPTCASSSPSRSARTASLPAARQAFNASPTCAVNG